MTANNETGTALEREFTNSLGELQAALQQAADATARIQSLIPRVGSISAVFAELDAVIRSGRETIGVMGGGAPAYTRPTLVVPSASPQPASPQPFTAPVSATSETDGAEVPVTAPPPSNPRTRQASPPFASSSRAAPARLTSVPLMTRSANIPPSATLPSSTTTAARRR